LHFQKFIVKLKLKCESHSVAFADVYTLFWLLCGVKNIGIWHNCLSKTLFEVAAGIVTTI